MTRDEFNRFCAGLGPATRVIQCGNTDVWKIGSKGFLAFVAEQMAVSFKCSDIAFEVLQDTPGIER